MSKTETPETVDTSAPVEEIPVEEIPDDGFGDFSVVTSNKPIAGVTDVEIPKRLVEFLAKEVPAVLANSADKELTLTAKDKATAQILAGYARAWGARQEPRKLYIRKLPNTKNMGENVARLAVSYDDEVPAENRAGRRK
jgi:hypothetical protein